MQRRDQVQGLPRPRAAARRGAHRHRPLRAGSPARRPLRAAARRRPGQGPELLPAPAEPGAAGPHAVPGRRPAEERGAANRPRDRPAQRRQARLDRHLLHRRAAVPRIPQPLPADEAGADPHAGGQGGRRARRPVLLHARPAQGHRRRRHEHETRRGRLRRAVVRRPQGHGRQHAVDRAGARPSMAAG